ncbi:MAG: flagellar basal body L-ring protein FlgH [Alphaproteobacteria bacterium]
MSTKILNLAVLLLLAVSLSACSTWDRLSAVGTEPQMTKVGNPTERSGYTPVSIPLPEKQTAANNPNSLWQAGSRSFFKDQRAAQVGDILTVIINIDDSAAMKNTSARSRKNKEGAGFSNALGLERIVNRILPGDDGSQNLAALESETSNKGSGEIDREEEIKLRVAALITQVLPNGNMVLHGKQETRVNFEVRELQVAGIIRPQDINFDNTVQYDKIAEARISYGGKGHISDVQQPRLGSQVLDIILPF